jgi:hypothetical protein
LEEDDLRVAGSGRTVIVSFWTRLSLPPEPVIERVGRRVFFYGHERAQTIYGKGLLVFDPIPNSRVLLFAFLETTSFGGHTNSRRHVAVSSSEVKIQAKGVGAGK